MFMAAVQTQDCDIIYHNYGINMVKSKIQLKVNFSRYW